MNKQFGVFEADLLHVCRCIVKKQKQLLFTEYPTILEHWNENDFINNAKFYEGKTRSLKCIIMQSNAFWSPIVARHCVVAEENGMFLNMLKVYVHVLSFRWFPTIWYAC